MRGSYYIQLQWHSLLLNKTFVFGMSASLPPLSFLGKTLLLLCQPLWFSDRLSERQLAGQRWRMKWIIYLSICADVPHSSHPIYSAPCTQTPVKVTFLWRIINNFLNPCITKVEQFDCWGFMLYLFIVKQYTVFLFKLFSAVSELLFPQPSALTH